MAASCTHGMPTPRACWYCMEDGNLDPTPAEPPPFVERTFTAKFDGQCESCNLMIHAGEAIAFLSDDTYQHASCASSDTAATAYCPAGCGRPTTDPYGGPCSECWDHRTPQQ